MDRAKIIIDELAKCSPAQIEGNGASVESVYLTTESVGVIVTQALTLRWEMERLQDDIELLEKRIPSSGL